MSDRKYRQHGYMDRSDDAKPKSAPKPQSRDNTFGPRTVNMAPTRTISRCAQCGAVLPALATPTTCPKCSFPLHSCKQCAHFDPGSRFECRQSITERVARKDAANTCTLYSIAVRVERETSTGFSKADDARRAFENLFKK